MTRWRATWPISVSNGLLSDAQPPPASGGVAAVTPPPAASPRWVGYALVAFGIVILGVFAATIDARQLGHALRGVRPGLLGVAAGLLVLQLLVRGLRWRYMIRTLTGTVISPKFAMVSVVAGIAAGSVVPARSFEMAKAILLKGSHGTSLGVSTSAMIVERMLDLVVVIGALMLAGLLLPHRTVTGNGVLLMTAAVFAVGAALVFAAPIQVCGWTAWALRILPCPPGLRGRARRLIDTLFESILLWRRHRTLGVLFSLSGCAVALDLVRVSTVFWGIGVALPAPYLVFTYLGAMVLGMALLIPGGVGVTEVSQVGLIALVAPAVAAPALVRSAVLVDRFLAYYIVTLVGAGVLIAYHRYRHVFH